MMLACQAGDGEWAKRLFEGRARLMHLSDRCGVTAAMRGILGSVQELWGQRVRF